MHSLFHTRHRTSLWLLVAVIAATLLIALPLLLNAAFAFFASLLG